MMMTRSQNREKTPANTPAVIPAKSKAPVKKRARQPLADKLGKVKVKVELEMEREEGGRKEDLKRTREVMEEERERKSKSPAEEPAKKRGRPPVTAKLGEVTVELEMEREEGRRKELELTRAREEMEKEREKMAKERDEWKVKEENYEKARLNLTKGANAEAAKAAAELAKRTAEATKSAAEVAKMKKNLEEGMEKVKEKETEVAKLLAQPPGMVGCVDKGLLSWLPPVDSITDTETFSPPVAIGGIRFQLGAGIKMRDAHQRRDLFINLYCNGNLTSRSSRTYFARVNFSITLKSTVQSKSNNCTKVFGPSRAWGWPFIPWASATDPTKGFVVNGNLTLEAQVTLICHYKDGTADVTSPIPLFSDVVLVVGGKKFYASRAFLSHFSDYFKALLYGSFAERGKETIDLPEDIDAGEFEIFLKMIYPQRKKAEITKESVIFLLRLADFFAVQSVMWECIDYLAGVPATEMSLSARLLLTEQYRLPELQHDLLDGVKAADDLKAVIKSTDFKDLSDPLQKAILEKHFKLSVPA